MSFLGNLYPIQLPAANRLCQKKQLLLSYPQGSGKTVITIAAAEKLLELCYINNVIVLCPTAINWQWLEKIEEFTDHGNDVRLVEAKSKSSRQYGANDTIYTIIPWSVFRKDYDRIYDQIQFDSTAIIADEAQEFSNFRSRTFKCIRRFKAEYRWAVTGTALSNKLEELYAVMEWVDPYCLPHWKKFEKLHIVRNPKTKQILKYKNLEPLNKYLLKTRLERINDLSGFPEVLKHKRYIEKSKEVIKNERALYSVLVDHNCNSSNFHSLTRFDAEVSKALHEARKSVCGEDKLEYAFKLINSILTESSHNNVVVFSFYKQPLYRLSELLSCNHSFFTGDQDKTDKRQATRDFKEGKSRVLLCSNAGKAGLDLPFANYTIHLDVPFSFGILDQRSTRTRRLNSDYNTVVVIFLLVHESIEEFFFQNTKSKGELHKAVFDGGTDKITMRPQSLTEYLAQYYEDDRRKSERIHRA